MIKYDDEFKKLNAMVLFECEKGNTLYGLPPKNGRICLEFVYMQPPDAILGGRYAMSCRSNRGGVSIAQGIELQRLIEIACKGYGSALDILYAPEQCIIYKHPIMDCLLSKRDMFLVKGAFLDSTDWQLDRLKKLRNEGKPLSYENDELTEIAINLAIAEDVAEGRLPRIRRPDIKEILQSATLEHLEEKRKKIIEKYTKKNFPPPLDEKSDAVYNLLLSMRKQYVPSEEEHDNTGQV